MSNIQLDPHTSNNMENQTKGQDNQQATTQSVSTIPIVVKQEEQLEVMQFLEMEDVLSRMDNQIEFNHSTTQQLSHNTSNSHKQSKTVQQQGYQNSTTIPIQQKEKRKEFVISTRCGQIQLTIERVLSFLIMILTITILLVMSILSTGTIVIQSKTEDACYTHVTSLIVNLNNIKVSFDIMLNTSKAQQRLISEINNTMKTVNKDLEALILDIPSYNKVNNLSRESVIPELRKNFNDFQNVQTIMLGNIEKNLKDLNFYKNNYLIQLQILLNSLNDPLIIADRAAYNEDLYMNYSASVNLILVSITLLIIVPVMIIVLVITIGRDNLFIDKLKKIDAHVVIEVMENPHSQVLFKEFCKRHEQYSKCLFLEKVLLYKEQCEKVYDLHDQIENLSDVSGSEATKSLNLELDILEAKKFELAFEIITEFLDNDSESFLGIKLLGGKRDIEKVKKIFDEKSMNLPDKLFKSFQTNVAVDLLQTYKQFQSQQKRNREERKKNRLVKLQKRK